MLQLINTGRKSRLEKREKYQLYFEHVVYVLDE